jgi:BMFP domain-containing protein YqiC
MRFHLFLLFATYLAGSAHAIKAQTASTFLSITPCRVADTRDSARGSLGAPGLATGTQRDFPILQSSCGIPANALSYALNVTAIPHESLPFLTMWPTGKSQPDVSTLNSYQGTVVANAAIVPAGANGSISAYAAGKTDLILDITGYFAPLPTSGASASSPAALLVTDNGGDNNVGLGMGALGNSLSGNANIAIGFNAGSSLASTSNSIQIGNVGQANDSGVIRLGTPGIHQKVFMAGITGTSIDIGDMVLVDENGQLGTIQSSIRYKEDVQSIGSSLSDALMRLHPVQFHYKQSTTRGEKPVQFGLIAEEVAKVFPQLVIRNRQGEVEAVQYHQLPALLLNELQRQRQTIDQQREEIKSQRGELQKERDELHSLLARMAALEDQARQQ